MKRWTQSDTLILAIMSHRKRHFSRPAVRHQDHEINIALSGEGMYQLGDEAPLTLSAGEILIMPGGTRHAIRVKRDFRMAAIHIHPKAFDALAAPKGTQSTLLAKLRTWTDPPMWRKMIAPESYSTLERLAEDAVVEQNRHAPAHARLLQSLATQAAVHMFRLMLSEAPAETSDETTRLIQTVRHWIDRHFSEPCGVVSLARMAHLAPTYFAARFREIVGTPPMTYVRQRRLEQARLLLGQTSQPAKVVAWSTGFSDVSHFNHTFKQAAGLTPLQFRARYQKLHRD